MNDEEFAIHVQDKRKRRMSKIDRMSPAHRELVHHYGLHVVTTMMQVGVTEPRKIKHAVEAVLDEFSPTRGTSSAQGIRATRQA